MTYDAGNPFRSVFIVDSAAANTVNYFVISMKGQIRYPSASHAFELAAGTSSIINHLLLPC